MADWPAWRYRKGEAKIFASPEDVPPNEGWVDSPALVTDDPPKKKRQKQEPDGNGNADSNAGA